MDMPQKHDAFAIMDRLNGLPKFGDPANRKVALLSEMFAQHANGVWWLMNPNDMYEGYSLCYASLSDLVRSWDMYLTGYDEIKKIWTLTVIG